MKLLDGLVDRLISLNEICMACGKSGDFRECYLCEECSRAIEFVQYNCRVCGRKITNLSIGKCSECLETYREESFDAIYSILEYNDLSRELLYSYKYEHKRYLAYYFAKILKDYILDKNIKFDLIVPLVSGSKRIAMRGFDHVEDICNIACDELKVDKLKLLSRYNHDRAFHKQDKNTRAKLIEDAFIYNDKAVEKYLCKNDIYNSRELKILLVDDVYTTGATMREACKEIRKYHNIVYGISILHS